MFAFFGHGSKTDQKTKPDSEAKSKRPGWEYMNEYIVASWKYKTSQIVFNRYQGSIRGYFSSSEI